MSSNDELGRTSVFVALPWYAQRHHPNAYRGTAGKFKVRYANPCSSLLCFGFNQLWCIAQNEGSHDWFAMLHADVEPEEGWLEKLVAEADKGGYDVMHALVPIKEYAGTYSTCIAHSREDRKWELRRRITAKEAFERLPETFGINEAILALGTDGFDYTDDLCLCPNTGCMVIRLSSAWDCFPGFRHEERLVVVTEKDGVKPLEHEGDPDGSPRPAGVLAALNLPEDWGMGMWCARRGLKVGATRAVRVVHHGDGLWANDCVWGQERDEAFFAVQGDRRVGVT